MNDKILTEEQFQEEIVNLQEVLRKVSSKVINMYNFVKDDKSYRDTTVQDANISNNETLRQLGMLDTCKGDD